jgi:hypothetical protein
MQPPLGASGRSIPETLYRSRSPRPPQKHPSRALQLSTWRALWRALGSALSSAVSIFCANGPSCSPLFASVMPPPNLPEICRNRDSNRRGSDYTNTPFSRHRQLSITELRRDVEQTPARTRFPAASWKTYRKSSRAWTSWTNGPTTTPSPRPRRCGTGSRPPPPRAGSKWKAAARSPTRSATGSPNPKPAGVRIPCTISSKSKSAS